MEHFTCQVLSRVTNVPQSNARNKSANIISPPTLQLDLERLSHLSKFSMSWEPTLGLESEVYTF